MSKTYGWEASKRERFDSFKSLRAQIIEPAKVEFKELAITSFVVNMMLRMPQAPNV